MASFTDNSNKSNSQALTRDQIVLLQTELVRFLGARIGIDGILGPLTAAAARDALNRGSGLIDYPVMALAEIASMSEVSGDAYTWVFQSDSELNSDPDSNALGSSNDLFWKRGTRVGSSKNTQLGTCDTVLILSDGYVEAIGVLIAGDSLKFVDTESYLCHPVRIFRRLHERLPQELISRYASIEAEDKEAEGIYQINTSALKLFQSFLIQQQIEVPIPIHEAYKFASERRLETYLQSAPKILPDLSTARLIGWTGAVWDSSSASLAEKVDEALSPSAIDNLGGTDANFPFVLDAPADSEDDLDRGPFALFLAQRLHLIWCQINGFAPGPGGGRMRVSSSDAETFILQIDSPWGGGKTTFANFVARVLDPRKEVLSEQHFLKSSIAPTETDVELRKRSLSKIFVPDFAKDDEASWPEAHRPWIIVRYNAWRDQYVIPPWWHIFQTIETAVAGEVWREVRANIRPANGIRPDMCSAAHAFVRLVTIKLLGYGYKLGNSRVKSQAILLLFMLIIISLLWTLGIIDYAIDTANLRAAGGAKAKLDPKELSAWLSLAVAVFGFTGASVATLFSVVTQSLSPDLDFTAEHKQIGVRDPISRFRRVFHRILSLSQRPVLLLVDDLDRCEPKTVVEILRGFQTIVRSPRLFVLLLGDRAWIETAHDVHHKDLATMRGSEGTLGSLFVQKVIQLTFRLPIIKEDARARYARKVLGDVEPKSQTADAVLAAITEADRGIDRAIRAGGTLADREEMVEAAKRLATEKLAGLGTAEKMAAATVIDRLANVRIVAAAGADTRQQQSVARAVERLIRSLPNNPRQIKRIFMAFSTYEAVGRTYFGYSLTAQGEDGERKARRWRQLALWVALATEWPDTWRSIARTPLLANAAFGDENERQAAEQRLMAEIFDDQRESMSALLRNLRGNCEIAALLGIDPNAADDFGRTRLESEAVFEFNRIIWEPGFRLQTDG